MYGVDQQADEGNAGEGHLTPYDRVLCQHNTYRLQLVGFHEKSAEKPTEKCYVRFRFFGFGRVETDRLFREKNGKSTKALFTFGSQHLPRTGKYSNDLLHSSC